MRAKDTADEPGGGLDPAKMPGHWLLARMGKRVLRPGGRELTRAMLVGLAIGANDDVVEFAPGLGATTTVVLASRPRSYVAVERDERAAATVSRLLTGAAHECRIGTAQRSGLDGASATVVFGEAFLTMQSTENKRAAVAEAFRVLEPGGRYGLHELALRPDNLDADQRDRVRQELSRSIRVGARPRTVAHWRELLEEAGFEIEHESTVTMGLLSPRRLVADEGVLGAARIAFNVARDRAARLRMREMRATFVRNADNLAAVALVAIKPRVGP